MRRLLDAYDVSRQLERGYSLTLRADGSLVRGAGSVVVGEELLTRFADGSVQSTVSGVAVASDPGDEGVVGDEGGDTP
jgi:exonuclease VII large subunit